MYNSNGIVGFRYHASSYASDVWDTYLYEKNLQGDIIAVYDGKLNFVAAAGADAVKAGAHAGNILKEISAVCGGKGGGRPDSAMSGGRDLDKVGEALALAEEIISKI